ncbi:hyaluronidase-like [Microplitis mediator]|uniref:hyaluronidase-like n=1 Tax=Microplitis mediator TaxID=375433 RepID=UPI002553353A|nr:hyaluronidase-like [Microplitis mediator]
MCQKYGIHMNDLHKFGIYQNENDKFRGEKIVILYDPGMFPALIKNHNGTITRRNGGVPQEGNLQSHLDLFTTHLEEQVDENFSGLGVIDFESWRPIFRQNWASLAPYRDLSIKLENERHPSWSKSTIKQRAVKSFESAGQLFMEETIKLAKKLRPHAHWSYYAYPYCFNLTLNQPSASCDPQLLNENNKLSWLWELEDVLLPSIYLRNSLSSTKRLELITKRLTEAARLNKKFPKRPLLPYFSFKFHDQKDVYLKKKDLQSSFNSMIKNGADGHIIWGSSQDFDSREKCLKFKKYLNDTLGPATEKIKLSYHLSHVEKPPLQ